MIDFDFFFPNPFDGGDPIAPDAPLYDWGDRETPLHIDPLWSARLHGFVAAGVALPYVVEPDRGWVSWWDRFTIADDAPLRVCDSCGWAGLQHGPLGRKFGSVWLYDIHHDAGYQPHSWPAGHAFSCEDWMLQHAVVGTRELHVRYPGWRINAFDEPTPPVPVDRAFDDGTSPPVEFTAVLACRSGAWVPPWCDHQFAALLEAYPGAVWHLDDQPLIREFDLDAELATAEQLAGGTGTPDRH